VNQQHYYGDQEEQVDERACDMENHEAAYPDKEEQNREKKE